MVTNVQESYEKYIYKSRYARYLDEEQRRENWYETVDRYINFFRFKLKDERIPWDELRMAISTKEIMPSMRCLMTAGLALEKDNVAGYNCSYVAIDDLRCFDEIMYILMCGTGVGFSVERQYINRLPEIPDRIVPDNAASIIVLDSKVGWAKALRNLISSLYSGVLPRWDTSRLRPAGARLRTFGGRASGPEPLEDLFKFVVHTFQGATGRKLNSLEVHDIVCKIADVVVCGGVRRSALLSLSNLTDLRMRNAKNGEWYYSEPQRALANNSVCYTERPDIGTFMDEWTSLYRSRSGERGIFNRVASQNMVPTRRESGYEFGTNPCSEIVLRSKQFCNLTEVIIRPDDSWSDIFRKVRLATILGTIQATLTTFRYLSKEWRTNTEQERLLGVSLTGIMDNQLLYSNEVILGENLHELKESAIAVNKEFAGYLGIPESTAITCIKPSGTVSQLCGTSSGIHPRYARYYIRRVRNDAKDPLAGHLIQQGVPHEVSRNNPNEVIFSFPIRSPDTSVTVKELSALDQLEIWKTYATYWCEHKPSVSIYVREDEWLAVAAWVYENWDIMNGVSFFPYDDHIYPQAPYEEIDKETYDKLVANFPASIDLDNFKEIEDATTAGKELACASGACEL